MVAWNAKIGVVSNQAVAPNGCSGAAGIWANITVGIDLKTSQPSVLEAAGRSVKHEIALDLHASVQAESMRDQLLSDAWTNNDWDE